MIDAATNEDRTPTAVVRLEALAEDDFTSAR
jgi:hypothetical protein